MQRRDDEGEDSGDLFDGRQIADYLRFVRGSLRRHAGMAASVFVTIVTLVACALAALPKTYHVEARLLAQRSQVLVVRGDGPDAGVAPTRGAVELIRGRDTLLAIIKENDLVQHYQDHRSLSQRAIHGVMSVLPHKAETEEDRVDAMVDMLEKKLTAWITDGTVSIAIEWPDADMARRIVDAAQKRFLAVRYAQEVNALAESIAIVAGHGAALKADVDAEVIALEALRSDKAPVKSDDPTVAAPIRSPGVAAPHAVAKPTVRPDVKPEQTELGASIAAKQRAVDELEDVRKRNLAELTARLADLRGTFTDSHPTIVDLRQKIAALSTPSAAVAGQRAELAALQSDYDRSAAEARGESAASAAGTQAVALGQRRATVATPPQLPTEILRLDGDLREDRTPAVVVARARLRDAMDKYALLRAQVQATQIDLETAQAAFKYRYSVVTPAQLPKVPVKPSVPLVMVAAVLAAALVALLLSVWRDVRSGRIIERWQIERLLDRPILGELVARVPGPVAK